MFTNEQLSFKKIINKIGAVESSRQRRKKQKIVLCFKYVSNLNRTPSLDKNPFFFLESKKSYTLTIQTSEFRRFF